jgi:hypothetical protein
MDKRGVRPEIPTNCLIYKNNNGGGCSLQRTRRREIPVNQF